MSSFARGVAAAWMYFDGRVSVAGAEFEDPGRFLWPVLLALFLFGFRLLMVGGLGGDALDPHSVG
ncbi:hypothetical protein [Streptomyces mirabilis]|uniref:hypothetical protein n=1 Tax=Streptomyces mirabilis TaxID=68239 RepID=UPI00210A5E4D|nr:hypothetical protein [Streptomyces mirabilis]